MSKHHNILVIEDDQSIQKLLAAWCRHLGHTVVSADNGMMALSWLTNSTPDYIITDLSMPEMDGFALIETLRHEKRFNRVKIIVLTGLDAKSVEQLDPFTVSAILQKPLKMAQLQMALHGDAPVV